MLQIKEIEVWNGQYSCPNCKRLYGNRNDIDTNFKIKNKYCSYCGQLIKWGSKNNKIKQLNDSK